MNSIFATILSTLLFSGPIAFALNCEYTLGTATLPNGQVFVMNSLAPDLSEALAKKGYLLSSVYSADLYFKVEAKEKFDGFTRGSITKLIMLDVITKEEVYTAVGNFTPGNKVADVAVVAKLPKCKNK